jgi:signal transduction histidine kinase
MSQPSYASAAPPGADRPRRPGSVLALRNWRLAVRLIVLVAIPTVLGLTLAGIRITDTTRSGQLYGQVSQLAALGQQVNGLAQATEDERTETAAFIAAGRPAAGRTLLTRQYATTSQRAATVKRSLLRLGGYSADTRSSAAAALTSIAALPGLRAEAGSSHIAALPVINGYSAAIRGLFQVNDSIAALTGNVALVVSVRTLSALARMEDDTTLQQAILTAALIEARLEPGAVTSLASAEAQQARDLALYRSSATPEQVWAVSKTLAEPQASQARGIELRATAAGDGPLTLSRGDRQQLTAGMAYTVGWMRHAKLQLASWVASFAQGLHRGAVRSALLTGTVALAALLLIVLATVIIARSLVRPLRRLETAALDLAAAGLPAVVGAPGQAGNGPLPRSPAPIDVRSSDEIGRVARAVNRVHEQALRLAGAEASMRASRTAFFASFLRRNSSLLEPLLRQIDGLELAEDDPERLAALFQLDQLATRMRRNSDSALVLAGDQTPRRWSGPVTLLDLLRAAVSETEQYGRIALDVEPAVSIAAITTVSASAAVDIAHLLAELLENATAFSPVSNEVSLSGRTALDGGWLVRITDRGEGLSDEELRHLNGLLAEPPLADAAVARHLGLFAVAHLAERHDIRVELGQPPGGGTTVEVHIPAALISPATETSAAIRFPPAGAGAEPGGAVPRARASPAAPGRPGVPVLGAPVPGVPVLGETGRAETGATRAGPAETDTAGTGPAEARALPAGLPIFDAVGSEHYGPRADGRWRPGGPGLGQAGLPRSAADREPGALATDRLTPAGLPQRGGPAAPGPDGGSDRSPPIAPPDQSAEIAQTRLVSFQQGARRARAAVKAATRAATADHPARDE